MNRYFSTFTKKAVTVILIVSLIDLQLSYILAFMGKEQIAESLSSTIADTIIGIMLGYFLKALFETFFDEREKRLNKKLEQDCSSEEDEKTERMMDMIDNMSPRSGRVLKEDDSVVNIVDLAEESLGRKGFEFISDTAEHTAPEGMVYVALQVVDDAVIASYETDEGAEITGNTFTGELLPAGFILYGRYTSVKFASGKVIVYKGV